VSAFFGDTAKSSGPAQSSAPGVSRRHHWLSPSAGAGAGIFVTLRSGVKDIGGRVAEISDRRSAIDRPDYRDTTRLSRCRARRMGRLQQKSGAAVRKTGEVGGLRTDCTEVRAVTAAQCGRKLQLHVHEINQRKVRNRPKKTHFARTHKRCLEAWGKQAWLTRSTKSAITVSARATT